jgi:hypothetical protein
MKALFAAIALIILSASVIGLGIGPAQVYRVHSPLTTEMLEFTVFGEPGSAVSISVRGDNVECPRSLTLASNQSTFLCSLTHPQSLSPGPHDTEVVVTESRKPEEGMISALPAAVSLVRMDVPRPGTYVEARLDVENSGSDAIFRITVHNFGSEAAECAATVSVEELSSKTQTKFIQSMGEDTIETRIALPAGPHQAQAILRCGSQEINLSEDFEVGEKRIVITVISVDPFVAGDVARIRISMENTWPVALDNVRAEVVMTDSGKTLQTETFSIADTREVSAYWDTSGIAAGPHAARATLVYSGALSTREFSILVPEAAKKKASLLMPTLLVAVALALFLIWLLLTKKKKRR